MDPVASLLIFNACNIGTPFASIVPRIRQNRVIDNIWNAVPATGIFMRAFSSQRRDDSLRMLDHNAPPAPIAPSANTYQYERTALLIAKITSVGRGFFAFASSGSNFGTKNISAPVMIDTPSNVSSAG